jgi:hypothetical protein
MTNLWTSIGSHGKRIVVINRWDGRNGMKHLECIIQTPTAKWYKIVKSKNGINDLYKLLFEKLELSGPTPTISAVDYIARAPLHIQD